MIVGAVSTLQTADLHLLDQVKKPHRLGGSMPQAELCSAVSHDTDNRVPVSLNSDLTC